MGKGGSGGVRKRDEETPKGTKEEKYEGVDDRGCRSMDGKMKGVRGVGGGERVNGVKGVKRVKRIQNSGGLWKWTAASSTSTATRYHHVCVCVWFCVCVGLQRSFEVCKGLARAQLLYASD